MSCLFLHNAIIPSKRSYGFFARYAANKGSSINVPAAIFVNKAPPLGYCGSDGYFSLNFKLEGTREAMVALAASHKDVHDALYAHAAPREEKRWYDSVERLRWKFARAGYDLRLFFQLLPACMQSHSAAWSFVEVSGPGEK